MKMSYLTSLISALLCCVASAEEHFSPAPNNYSQSNHGGIGLIQMPTARDE